MAKLKILAIILLLPVGFLMGNLYTKVNSLGGRAVRSENKNTVDKEKVLPQKGFDLPIEWGDMGPKLIELGVIDEKKFVETVNVNSEEEKILKEGSSSPININADNSQFVVDMLWAIGLAQESTAYKTGPMGTEYKKDIGNFASTGGWSLGKTKATNYIGKYDFFNLTDEQNKRVEEIAKNVYRPCCNNSTWFPDCNHGMAALAAIEMMVAKNMSDDDIYKNILKLNSFWFPGTYMTTAQYFANKGVSWDKVDAKTVLGEKYSSSAGAAKITQEVNPVKGDGKAPGCGA